VRAGENIRKRTESVEVALEISGTAGTVGPTLLAEGLVIPVMGTLQRQESLTALARGIQGRSAPTPPGLRRT